MNLSEKMSGIDFAKVYADYVVDPALFVLLSNSVLFDLAYHAHRSAESKNAATATLVGLAAGTIATYVNKQVVIPGSQALVNSAREKRRDRHGSGIFGWLRTALLGVAAYATLSHTIPVLMEDGSSPQAESETKQQFVKEDFTDLDTVTHKGYNIFRYNGTETKHKEISDLFDEWDDSHGDKCRNTSKRNIFHGSNNSGTYIFANCGSDKTLSNKESTIIKQFKPYSKEAIKLFKQAVELADVPVNWAESESLHWILKQESGGYVGKPNYTIRTKDGRLAANNPETWAEIHYELKHGTLKPGSRRAKSSATGLGQLLLRNVEEYYPSGVDGIGVPLEEAAGMLAYIKDRYGNPDVAKRLYGSKHEGY